jgi:hypothetical protein
MTIAAGATGTGSGTVTYSVSSNGGAQRSGTLAVAGKTVTVTQAAAAVTAADLTPASIDFGKVQLRRTSAAKTATFRNSGTATITLSSVTLGGANAGDFVTSGDCVAGLVLQPGQSCSVSLAFAPKEWGTRSATMAFASDAGNKVLTLTGIGRDNGRGGS